VRVPTPYSAWGQSLRRSPSGTPGWAEKFRGEGRPRDHRSRPWWQRSSARRSSWARSGKTLVPERPGCPVEHLVQFGPARSARAVGPLRHGKVAARTIELKEPIDDRDLGHAHARRLLVGTPRSWYVAWLLSQTVTVTRKTRLGRSFHTGRADRTDCSMALRRGLVPSPALTGRVGISARSWETHGRWDQLTDALQDKLTIRHQAPRESLPGCFQPAELLADALRGKQTNMIRYALTSGLVHHGVPWFLVMTRSGTRCTL